MGSFREILLVVTPYILDQWFPTYGAQPLWVSIDPFSGVTHNHQKADIYIKVYNSSKMTVMK